METRSKQILKQGKVLILKGLPGSGKTTYAKKIIAKKLYKFIRVNKDEIRLMINGEKWANKNEDLVLQIRDLIITKALKIGVNVIVDDTNLNPFHIGKIRKLVKNKAHIKIVDFTNTPLATCIQRDKKRTSGVGEKVIKDMYAKYIKG